MADLEGRVLGVRVDRPLVIFCDFCEGVVMVGLRWGTSVSTTRREVRRVEDVRGTGVDSISGDESTRRRFRGEDERNVESFVGV